MNDEDVVRSPQGRELKLVIDGASPGREEPEGGTWTVYLDGEKVLSFTRVSTMWFTRDGEHHVIVGNTGGEWDEDGRFDGGDNHVAFDGVLGDPLLWVSPEPCHSPDGAHVALEVLRGVKWPGVWLDGRILKEYHHAREPRFLADGRLVLIGRQDELDFLVTGEERGPGYDRIDALSITPDGKRWIYRVHHRDQSFMVIDGVEQSRFHWLAPPQISPCGTRTAYGASPRSGKWHAVVDGVPGKIYDSVDFLRFSPDGKRFGYIAKSGEGMCVVIDGVEGPVQPWIGSFDF